MKGKKAWKNYSLLFIVFFVTAATTRAQKLTLGDDGNTVFTSELYKFSFSLPEGYTINSITGSDHTWLIKNTEHTFGMTIDILQTEGASYEQFVKDFAANFIAKAATHNAITFVSNRSEGLVLDHQCPVPGFKSDAISYYLVSSDDEIYQFHVKLMKKTTNTNFGSEGFIFYGFQNDEENKARQTTLVTMFEKTIRFTNAAPVVVKTVPTVVSIPVPVKETGPVRKKGMYEFRDSNYKVGFKNELYEVVWEPQFETQYSTWSGGFAALKKDGKWGFIDSTGKVVIPFEYLDCNNFHQGYVAVRNSAGWGFIDERNNIQVGMYFRDARYFSEGYAAMNLDGKWGFVDFDGNHKILFTFDDARDFSEGAVAVKKEGTWDYINKEGKYLTNGGFEEAGFFYDGKAKVKKDGVEFYIDKAGKKLN